MALTVVEYVREDGSSPYRKCRRESGDGRAAARDGQYVERKWIGAIGEYRVDWGPGLRLYLAKDGETLVVLLGGGTKKAQRVDIERARASWAEYKARKATAARRSGKR